MGKLAGAEAVFHKESTSSRLTDEVVPFGGSEGPENVPVAHFHRGTGRQAPESERPENRPVACFQRTAGRQAPVVDRIWARRMRLFRLYSIQELIVSSFA